MKAVSGTKSSAAVTIAIAAFLAGGLVLSSFESAHADIIFDFTFQGDSGAPGTVTGEVDLPDSATNGQPTAALHVFIDSATISFPAPLPFDTINQNNSNSFTLTNGDITAHRYNAQGAVSGSFYNLSFLGGIFPNLLQVNGILIENASDVITFTPVSVPGPSLVLACPA